MDPSTQKQLPPAAEPPASWFVRLRAALRRVMPKVAIAAAALFILRNLLSGTFVFGTNPFGTAMRALTFLVVAFTILYYGLKGLRWLKRRLLWRVRRRLVVTYLFVGLTPIILLALLGLLAAFGGSSEGMARLAVGQLNDSDRQTQGAARGLGAEVSALPPTTTDKDLQAWLVQRGAVVRASLPGARLALWRGKESEDAAKVGSAETEIVSEQIDDQTKGVGDDSGSPGAPLPAWLNGKTEWNGMAYTMPEGPDAPFGAPTFRALIRGQMGKRPFALLVIYPVSRALLDRYRENTDLILHPFFSTNQIIVGNGGVNVTTKETNANQADNRSPTPREQADRARREARRRASADQFGEPLGTQMYFVLHPATQWDSGELSDHLVFFFDWSWALAGKQFLGNNNIGSLWWTALKIVGTILLIFELLALIAAIWMTRAVTGTVHKLYLATQHFKRGDFAHRVRVRSRDQLGELASAFNDMSSNIEVLLQERVEREKLEREVEIAAEVQARLFPSKVPDLVTVELAAECRAARGVAGDYYDYVEIAPGMAALALGDVSGKGMSASLVMANLQASLRSQAAITAERLSIAQRAVAAAVNTSDNRVLARVVADADIDGAISRHAANINLQLCQSTDANRFATLFLSLYEDRTRTLRYTNAGHNPPILIRADGSAERLTVGGMMVGAFDFATYEEASVRLEPDDMLVIFSDGISEAEHHTSGEEFTEARLLQLITERRTLSAHDLRNAIFDEIDRWSGAKERGDDQTLLIVRGEA